MSDTYCIYMHTNIVNGKRYIGQTRQDVQDRWGKNGSGYTGCTHFWNAIQKYGWDNFSHEILEEGLTENEANEKERFYIKKYNSTNKDFGYNMQFGGQDHREFTEDVKQKISTAVKELWQDDEYVSKMAFHKGHEPFESDGALGMHWYNNGTDEVLCMESDKPNGYVDGKLSSWNRGKHLTEEHKKAISDAQKGKVISEEQLQKMISTKEKNGTLHLKTKGSSGMHWYNNGVEQILCLDENAPINFVRGMLHNSTPESRKANSEAHKGKTPWNKGRHWTEEERFKISIATKNALNNKEVV